MTWDVNSDPVNFDEAIAWFKKRVPMTKDERDALDARAKRQAFFVSGATHLDLVKHVWKALEKALADGTPVSTFKKDVGADLRKAWGGSVADPSRRLDTIFRVNVQQAYSAGRYRQATDPDVLADRPVWMFDAVLDGRTSKTCKSCDGTKLPADDTWWQSHTPPLHFNCRSGFIALSEGQTVDAGGVSATKPRTKPQDGFGVAPTDAPALTWLHDKLSAAPSPLARIAASEFGGAPPPPGGGQYDEGPPPPPWHSKKSRKRGAIDTSERTVDKLEERTVDLLVRQGNDVKMREVVEGQRNFDAWVNGAPVEFKRVQTPTIRAISKAIRRCAHGMGQAKSLIIDMTGTGLTAEELAKAVALARRNVAGRVDYVRIIGDNKYDETFSYLPTTP